MEVLEQLLCDTWVSCRREGQGWQEPETGGGGRSQQEKNQNEQQGEKKRQKKAPRE